MIEFHCTQTTGSSLVYPHRICSTCAKNAFTSICAIHDKGDRYDLLAEVIWIKSFQVNWDIIWLFYPWFKICTWRDVVSLVLMYLIAENLSFRVFQLITCDRVLRIWDTLCEVSKGKEWSIKRHKTLTNRNV